MTITAAMVKELRELTGAGVMACKKALVETDGNQEAAIEVLRKKGEATAVKKSGRIAAEGIVYTTVKDGKAAIVEVNSETDFVAKNDEFQQFVSDVAKTIAEQNPADVEALKELKCGDSTIGEMLTEKIAKIGENMNIRRFARIETTGAVVDYIHAAGKIGVLVEADAENNDATKECLRNVAMQVAALSPKYLSSDDIPEEYKEHEKKILIEQLKNDPKNASKPENIIEKMITGRLAKEFKEVCLLEQEYVKAENKENVAKYVKSIGDITIKQFVRFETGEGLEKREDDFAAEVASMVK